jgi:hypothetical protein
LAKKEKSILELMLLKMLHIIPLHQAFLCSSYHALTALYGVTPQPLKPFLSKSSVIQK